MKKTTKVTVITSILLLVAIATFGQESLTLNVKINDLRSDNGKIMIQLSDKDQNTIGAEIATINDGICSVKFNSLKAGTYAIRYFHDENENGELDTGTFGIPTEGFGFSNDARGFMGPPSFDDQLFELNGNKSITLATKY